MRFKLDENIHPDAAEFLRANGHDALTVRDQGLGGHDDGDIADAWPATRRRCKPQVSASVDPALRDGK